jgi:hypothetical protein
MSSAHLVAPETSCLPCTRGAHVLCRHYPDGPRFARGDKSEPCNCESSGHTITLDSCSANVDSSFGSHRCGKGVKGTAPVSYTWGMSHAFGPTDNIDVPVCGVHAAAYRRRQANESARLEAEAARRAQRDRDAETTRSLEETAARLRPLLEKLGIRPDLLRVDAHALALPGEALESLVRLAIEGDELRNL